MVAKSDIIDFMDHNFHYNREKGEFTWLEDRANGKIKSGSKVGSRTSKGYLQVRILGKSYKVHRLVWLIETGEWPSNQIDHINRDKGDNRFENLRECSNYSNCLNRGRKSSSGYIGVTYDKVNKKWLAQTYKNGRALNLGRYECKERAREAYINANLERFAYDK